MGPHEPVSLFWVSMLPSGTWPEKSKNHCMKLILAFTCNNHHQHIEVVQYPVADVYPLE